MFAGWGSWVARFRWPVLAVALVAVVSSGLWGLGVFGQLTEGGYNDPNSDSAHAAAIVQQALGTPSGDVVAIYTPVKGKIGDAALTKQIKARLAALPTTAVKSTSSYWQSKSAKYMAKDKSSAVAVITLVGPGDGAKADQFRTIKNDFAVDGATVQLAGGVPLNDASSTRSSSDLGTAELISLPITLVLLLFIFGSLVAAGLPVLIGGASVLGSLGILHAIASHTEVNSFAVNVASLLGLGMAIDYGLFMVGRFREEQAAGHAPADAVRRTVGTAGRTVLFSATLLMIALSGLLLFPQGFLKSLAYGGLSAVALAAILSLTLLPALLAVLGPRVDKLPIRLPRRRASAPAGSVWARVAGFVLRHRVLVALPILAVLVLLAWPVRGVHFGDSDERILPAGDPARVAVEKLKVDYPQFANNGVQIVLIGTQDTGPFAAAARAVPGIDQLGPTVKTSQGAVLTATLTSDDPYSTAARDAVDGIRALPLPPGASLLVGGTTARNLDSLHATAAKLPWMVALLAGATLVLMFLAFGSILLPIKAVVMSALSLSATFGVLVWIFEDGHLAGLLNITPAPLEVGIVVLMAAVVFGLSTDYEVFLLSRMVEARTRGATTAEAITTGLARTGRVISAAAVLLIVVTGAFALSAVTTMRFVGVGMIIALLLDATIVRMLLVPAVLGLLGDAAWWAPGPLRRLQQRAGLSEYGVPEPGGKHALPEDTAVLAGPAPRRALPSTTPVPELLFRDVPSGALPALTAQAAPIALPSGPMDVTVVFPAVDASGLSSTVRIELEPTGDHDESAETVDAELLEGSEDLEATGILTLDPEPDDITDAEVVADPPAAEGPSADAEPPVAESPVAGSHVADSLAADSPVADSRTAESPLAESPLAESPLAESPLAESPLAESPLAESSVAESPVASPSVDDAVIGGSPAAESSLAEPPNSDSAVTDSPVAGAPAAGGAVAESSFSGPTAADSRTAAEEALAEPPNSDSAATDYSISSPTAAEAALAETPNSDSFAAESVTAGAPVMDTPVEESPTAGSHATDSPIAGSPAAESPVSEPPVAESPMANSPVLEPSTADSPMTGAATENESLVEEHPQHAMAEVHEPVAPDVHQVVADDEQDLADGVATPTEAITAYTPIAPEAAGVADEARAPGSVDEPSSANNPTATVQPTAADAAPEPRPGTGWAEVLPPDTTISDARPQNLPADVAAAYEPPATHEPAEDATAAHEPAEDAIADMAADEPHPGTGWGQVEQSDTTFFDARPQPGNYEPDVNDELGVSGGPVSADAPDSLQKPDALDEASPRQELGGSSALQELGGSSALQELDEPSPLHEPNASDEPGPSYRSAADANASYAASEPHPGTGWGPVEQSGTTVSEPLPQAAADDTAAVQTHSAEHEQGAGHEQAAEYEQTAEYRQTAEYEQAAEYRQTAEYRQVAEHEEAAEHEQIAAEGRGLSDVAALGEPDAAGDVEAVEVGEAVSKADEAGAETSSGWASDAVVGGDAAYRMKPEADAELAPNSGSEPVFDGEAEPLATKAPYTQAEPASASATYAEPEPGAEPAPYAGVEAAEEPAPQAETEASAESAPYAQTEPALHAETEPDPEPAPHTEAEATEPALNAPAEAEAEREPDGTGTGGSDTPLFAGTGGSSFAALFPELFAPEPEPAVERYPDWSEPVSEDAFFAPAAADPFLYRQEPSADERYVTFTPADDSAPERSDIGQASTVDLSGRFDAFSPRTEPVAEEAPPPQDPTPAFEPAEAAAQEATSGFEPTPPPTAEAAPPRAFESAPQPAYEPPFDWASPRQSQPDYERITEPTFDPTPQRASEAVSPFEPAAPLSSATTPQPAWEAGTPEPAWEAATPQPAWEATPTQPAWEATTPQPAWEATTPQPAWEAAPPQPAWEAAAPQPAREAVSPPEPDFVPEPAFRAVPQPAAEAPRPPSDLSEIAAAWRQVIEHRPPVTERPADLAGYVGQATRRPTPAPEQPKPHRPTDLGSYPPARREAARHEPARQEPAQPEPARRNPARPADMGEMISGRRTAAGSREARPADLSQYGATRPPPEPAKRAETKRPETLGDQKPVRRPASLADTPAPRRPRDVAPADGPTRDLSRYVDQDER